MLTGKNMERLRRFFCKGSILIPIAFICYLFSVPVSIYVRELGLYLGYGASSFMLLSLSLLWLCCSPFRKGCCDGSWSEVLFNIVPIECFLMLIFAQWHFAAALLLGAVTVCISIAFTLALRREERAIPVSKKMRRKNRATVKRFFVLAVAAVCTVPCLVSAFVFDLRSPTYEAEQEILAQLFSPEETPEEEETDLFAGNQPFLLGFQESVWKTYSLQEKITRLQQLGNLESQRLGIPSVSIKSKKLNPYTLGEYDWSAKEIWIDLEHLEESPVTDCIRTICHEMWHAQQNYILENIDWESELMQSAYFAEIRAWRENASHYQDADISGYDAYAQQPLEASAAAYAEEETDLILSYIYQ